MSDVAPSTTPAPTSDPSGGAPSTTPASPPAASSSGANTNQNQTAPATRNLKSQFTDSKAPAAPADNSTKPPEAQKEAWRRKFKLKIDGQEIEEELDETAITTRLQKAAAADKRFREAAARTKEINDLLQMVRTDPRTFLEKTGVDPIQFAEALIAEQYNQKIMTPEEREQAELKKKLAEYERREAEQKKAEEMARQKQYEARVFEETEKEMLSVLEELGYEDKAFERGFLLPLAAEIMLVNEQHGIKLSPKQVTGLVKERLATIHKKEIATYKGSRLLDYLGPAVVNEVIRARLEQRRGSDTPPPPPAPKPAPALTEQKPRRKVDWFTEQILLGGEG